VADEKLDVELVSVDKRVWTGEATFVRARTVDGEIGVLPGHWDHLSVLVPGGVVDIRHDETKTLAAVHGGFLLVHDNVVRILAETAELGDEIDVSRARASLDRAQASDDARRRSGGARRGPTAGGR
jgi:F-type H+-transporting ATPase subunit epsilon